MTTQTCHSPVVVWGGGTGGVAAALQAARSGAKTLLLTPGRWLGGMVSTAGVCCPDGNELAPWQTGLWGAFLRALYQTEPEGLDQNWLVVLVIGQRQLNGFFKIGCRNSRIFSGGLIVSCWMWNVQDQRCKQC